MAVNRYGFIDGAQGIGLSVEIAGAVAFAALPLVSKNSSPTPVPRLDLAAQVRRGMPWPEWLGRAWAGGGRRGRIRWQLCRAT